MGCPEGTSMRSTTSTDSPFLAGAFAPVDEEVTAYDLPVSGTLPAALDGWYLRNGPNPLGFEDPAAHHWFLGDGMVHGVRLRDGRAAWYRNRWVRSRRAAQRLGEQPPDSGVVDEFDFGANTHVIGHAGRLLALVEGGPRPYELTPDLETVGPCDLDGGLADGFAAHTKRDPATGELHAVTYDLRRADEVAHVVVDREGRVVRRQPVAVTDGPMMHDFALTERYVVLYDLPVTFSADAPAGSYPYAWNPDHPARIGLLPRTGSASQIRWFDVEPCWVFHTVNAYEDGESVVVDVCRYPRMFDVSAFRSAAPPSLDRWRLHVASGRATHERLHDRAQEFPRIDERRTAARHRFAYTMTAGEVELFGVDGDLEDLDDRAFGNAVIKHDLATGATQVHDFGRHAAVGEPVFVPAADDAAEDDGWVLTFVHDPRRGATDLVVLAAQDLAGPPVAAVHLPVRVPLGFHGSWIPNR